PRPSGAGPRAPAPRGYPGLLPGGADGQRAGHRALQGDGLRARGPAARLLPRRHGRADPLPAAVRGLFREYRTDPTDRTNPSDFPCLISARDFSIFPGDRSERPAVTKNGPAVSGPHPPDLTTHRRNSPMRSYHDSNLPPNAFSPSFLDRL